MCVRVRVYCMSCVCPSVFLTLPHPLLILIPPHPLVVFPFPPSPPTPSPAQVGAASTLDADNLHRGEPWFPVMCWRQGQGRGVGRGVGQGVGQEGQAEALTVLQGGAEGAEF
jgi:hypothetical protein